MSPEKVGYGVEWKDDTPEITVQRVSQVEKIVVGIVRNVMQVILHGVVERTPVGDPKTDWHYGQLKASWTPVQETEGGFSFSTGIPYAIVLEKGMYKKTGPRTVAYEDGIFSSQAPGGMITPIVTNEELMNTIVKNVTNAVLDKILKRGKSA